MPFSTDWLSLLCGLEIGQKLAEIDLNFRKVLLNS